MSYTIERGGYFCAECGGELTREGPQVCGNTPDHVGREWSEGLEVEVEVYVRLSPVDPGRYSGPPEDCYPAEGGDVLDFTVSVEGVKLRLAEEDELVDAAQEYELSNPPEPDYPDPEDNYVDDWLS